MIGFGITKKKSC